MLGWHSSGSDSIRGTSPCLPVRDVSWKRLDIFGKVVMSEVDGWHPEARWVLSVEEALAVAALRDRCNADDGLDLKIDMPTHASSEPEATRWPQAFLIHSASSLVGYCSLDGDRHTVEICGMVA